MADLVAAECYARALYEIAVETDQDVKIGDELRQFAEGLDESPEMERFLLNPRFPIEEKRKFLMRLYPSRGQDGLKAVMLDFLTVLLKKHRIDLAREIASAFRRISDQARGEATVEIHSAMPLNDRQEQQIVSRLEKIAGYKIEVKKSVEPLLIGGVMVKLGHRVIDGTARRQLEMFRKDLKEIRKI